MKKIITYGTYDVLHAGHINLLRRAKELGDHLIVGISTDKFNEMKGKQAYYSFEQRKAILEAVKYVDEVIPDDSCEETAHYIKKYGIESLVMGDIWKGKFDVFEELCEVKYLPRTVGISSTKIKGDLMGKDK